MNENSLLFNPAILSDAVCAATFVWWAGDDSLLFSDRICRIEQD
jgi:hypothetical protein